MKKNSLILGAVLFLTMSVFGQSPAQQGALLPLSIGDYVKRVEDNNLDIRSAALSVEKANAQVKEAMAGFLPMLAVQGGYNYNNDLDSVTPAVVGASTMAVNGLYPAVSAPADSSYDHTLSLGVGLQETLSASAVASYKQAKKGAALQGAAYSLTRDTVVTGAKKLYMGTLLAKEAAAIRKESAQVGRETYDSLVRKQKAGAATELDVMQAEVDWRNLDALAQAAEQNFQVVLLQLKNLAGIPLETWVSFADEAEATQAVQDAVPKAPDMPEVAGILGKSPDYLVQLLQSDLAVLQKQAALEAFLHTLSLALNYGFADMKGIGNGKSINSGNKWLSNTPNATAQQQFTIGINVTIPIVQGGYRMAKIKEAEAAKEQASTDLANKERAIRLQLAQIQQKLESDITQVQNYILIQDTAQRGLQTAQASFRNGVITRLDLADARNQAEQARLGYENAVYNLACDWFDWLHVTGEAI
jgi:outer membrane protein TolC